MPRKTGSRTGARSAASSAETRTWLFRWLQRARGESAPHPIDVMATPLCPLPVVSAFTRVFNALWRGEGTCRADGLWAALTGLRDDNLGKRTIARRGSVKRRHWRDANDDHAQNKGGRPGAARRSGPATFDFATGAGAACRAP